MGPASFQIVPVIDLKGGVVVRALAGRRDDYRPLASSLVPGHSSAPAEVAAALLEATGAGTLYVADLDAIVAASDEHARLVAELALLARARATALWLDAGTRTYARGLAAVRRVAGSESLRAADWRATLADEAILSLDFRGGEFLGPPAILADPESWPEEIIVMELARVGTAGGPNLARLREIIARAGGRRCYGAGGVRGMSDIEALRQAGAAGCLVASALHDGSLSPAWLACQR